MSRSAYLLFVKEEDGSQKELATVKISQQGGQVLEAVDFSEDGKIDTLQQHVKGEGIPIVLMGDGFAWNFLEFDKLNCLIQKGNKASECLAEKLGFMFREEMDLDGKCMKRYTISKSGA